MRKRCPTHGLTMHDTSKLKRGQITVVDTEILAGTQISINFYNFRR